MDGQVGSNFGPAACSGSEASFEQATKADANKGANVRRVIIILECS
jgi:hypothetical protein